MSNREVSLPPRQIATAMHNSLIACFFEAEKVAAKQLFLALQRGESAPFMEISVRDGGKIRCDLQLDVTQFAGRLNYSKFRRALGSHVKRLAGALEADADLNLYRSDEINGIVYNHPGVIEDDGQVNFLLSGVRQDKPGLVIVQLFFVDPGILGLDAGDGGA